METREIKLWQRAVAMLCVIAMLMMQFPVGAMQTFAAEGTLAASADAASLYADAEDDTNSTTVRVSDLTAVDGETITYAWTVTSGEEIVTVSNEDTSVGTATVTANAEKCGEVTLQVTATITPTEGEPSTQDASVTITVYKALTETFSASVTPESAYVGTTLTAAAQLGDNTSPAGVTYQWNDATGEISGATDSTYTPAAAGSYYVVATYPQDDTAYTAAATAESNRVTVSAKGTPVISVSQPETITYGDASVILTLGASTEGSFAISDISGTESINGTEVILDTSSAGTKSFTYTFTPDSEAYSSVSDTVSYTVDPIVLTFDVTVEDKDYDGTTEVDGAITIALATGSNGVLTSDGGTVSLSTTSDVVTVLTNSDLVFASEGFVSVDTDSVAVSVVASNVYVVIGDAVNTNYTAAINDITASIKANTEMADTLSDTKYTIATPDYTSGSVYWYKDSIGVTAADGYQLCLTMNGSYTSALIEVAPANNGSLVFYAKSTTSNSPGHGNNNPIQEITLSASIFKVDSAAPTITHSIDTSMYFSNEDVVYTITVADSDSGVATSSVAYYVADSATTPASDDSGWVTASGEADEYTFTVTVPESGYLYVKAVDNVGNEKISDAIHPLVLENDAPTVVLTETDENAGSLAQSHTVSVSVNDNKNSDEAEPYDYSGVDIVTYSVVAGQYTDADGFAAATQEFVKDGELTDNSTPTSMSEISRYATYTTDIMLDTTEISTLSGYTGYVTIAVTVRDFCGNETVTYIAVQLDNTAPTATITYTSSATPNLYTEDAGETAYYNQDVTVSILFDEVAADDYDTLYVVKDGVATAINATTDTFALTTSAVDNSATVTFTVSEDASYTFGAYGTDYVGNALVVTEYTPGSDTTVAADDVESKTSYTSAYIIVVDTTAPTYTFEIVTAATNQDLQTVGNRYYFNDGYIATVTVSDDNLDDDSIVVERDSDTLTTGINSATATLDFGDNSVETLAIVDGIATDEITEDGLYRYQVSGSDKAGNALEPEEGQTTLQTTSESYYIVVDTEAPTGTLNISNTSGESYYTITTDGTLTLAIPYRSETEANLLFAVDAAETSPVVIEYTLDSTLTANNKVVTDESFVFGKTVVDSISGEQIFNVQNYSITDLAGNVSDVIEATNKIYLDVSVPTYDKLAPTISVVANANSSANGPDGQPLFNSSVPVEIEITDPNEAISSSGLGEVTWAIYINGSTTATDSDTLSTALTGEYTTSYSDETGFVYTINPTLTFDSSTYNYNDLKLVVTAYDNAGNVTVQSYDFGIDVTKPTISITYDNNDADNDKYFSEIRTATVVVTERNFDSSKITVTTEGSVGSWSYSAGSSANGDDDTWTTQILYAVDGEYTLEISGQDLVGNNADSVTYTGVATNDFVIDTTVPVVTVTYNTSDASNGMYYNVDRIATITVDDVNFVGTNDIVVTATAGGVAPSVAFAGNATTLSFTADGNYVFGGTVTDLAGNVSAVINEAEFVIDQTLPEISISGVEDLSANRDPLDIVLSMTDTNLNLSSITATLTGTNNGEVDISGNAAYISGGVEYVLDTIETDDYYLLVFVGTDLAGNSVSQSVSFSENQNGTVFEFVQEEVRNTYSNQSFAPSFILHNVDEVTVLSLTLNGEEVAYDYVDNTVTFREALTADGMYKITMDTVDAAGNENAMETVEFYLDFTAPVLSVDGAEDGEYYFEAFTVTLRQDNSADGYLLLQLNGKDLDEGDYTVNADGSISIAIDTFQEYQLTAQLIDAAGNTSEVVDISFELTNNIFIRWYANKVLFFGSLAVATVLIAALILIVLKKKSKEEEPANV